MNLNILPLAPSTPSPPYHSLWQRLDNLAIQSLYDELNLELKPGLVCPSSNGSHTDMDYTTFVKSIDSLQGYFATLSQFGYEHRSFSELQQQGIYQEQVMKAATNQINTHKGAIFNMGFISAAVGRCLAKEIPITAQTVCQQITQNWQHALLHQLQRQPNSHGQQIYQKYGITGAIELVAGGFQVVQQSALPCLYATYAATQDFHKATMQTLMGLVATLADTNLVWRGGLAGLTLAQQLAKEFLSVGGVMAEGWETQLADINRIFIGNNLSPGGSADLLAVTLLLFRIEHEFNRLI